uniref:PH domain-containing protein n=1 Tax=Eptatretus burgeri TaxID=7764 RepID=A0A8C4NGT4_EPTBU
MACRRKTWMDASIRLGRTAIYVKEMQGPWVSKQSTAKNWVEVVLQGAHVVAGSNHSAKKNIIQLTTADKDVYLLHNEKEDVCKEWISSIQAVISQLRCDELTTETEAVVEEKHVLPSRRIIWPVTRSNSNTETMDRHSIKNKLRKFIVRRPTRQILEAKGIIKGFWVPPAHVMPERVLHHTKVCPSLCTSHRQKRFENGWDLQSEWKLGHDTKVEIHRRSW